MPLAAESALAGAISAAFARDVPSALGVAVSGGGDSMALLHLAHDWCRDHGVPLSAVTVDHGLRPAAAHEAAMVGATCAGMGVHHDILHWQGWDGQGNLQDAARRGRQVLIGSWARGHGIGAVLLGHTADDQAETVLMRLARGSGVDGLTGMARQRHAFGIDWLRPLLGIRRQALRDYLVARGQGWADDPSNEDPRFDRVRARQALAALAPLGVTVDGLTDTAWRMGLARDALNDLALRAARATCRTEGGDVVINRDLFRDYPLETRLRLAAHALAWISGAEYRPRLTALTEALEQSMGGRARTLQGALLLPQGDDLRITREYAALRDQVCEPGAVWDGRWRVQGPATPGAQVRALGEDGLRACAEWRASGFPRETLIASPAIWKNGALLAAPLAGMAKDWQIKPAKPWDQFFVGLLSH